MKYEFLTKWSAQRPDRLSNMQKSWSVTSLSEEKDTATELEKFSLKNLEIEEVTQARVFLPTTSKPESILYNE